MPKPPLWDPDFIESCMEEVEEMVTDAMKSRSRRFEETFTMTTMGRRVEQITVTVVKERIA